MVNEETPSNIENLGEKARGAITHLENLVKTEHDAAKATEGFGGFVRSAIDELKSYSQQLSNVGISLEKTNTLTKSQTEGLALAQIGITGVAQAYKGFAGIDTSHLDTFTEQLNYIKTLSGSSGTAINAMADLAKSAFNTMVPEAILKKGEKAVTNFVEGLATAADNNLRVREGFIHLSAATGNLGNVFAAAGPHLENLNALVGQQKIMIETAGAATGLGREEAAKYYAELGKIPGALESLVSTGAAGTDSVSMLTAAMQVASGTGRSQKDITEAMGVAFTDYNMKGEDALKFTVRMSEIANKFGGNLGAVRASMITTANAFKMFGNEAEGSARILNNYVGLLTSGKFGLSADAAVEATTAMTNSIKEMNIAQKAFLSAQSGGPSGLMGGFKIDKMLREGKLDEVMEDVRKTMTKQMGKIVSLDEAASSPGAAAQRQKQLTMLQHGPLGSIVNDDATAGRVLDAFRAKQEGKTAEPLKDNILKDTMVQGKDIQMKTYTSVDRIRAILEQEAGARDTAVTDVIERGITAGSGQEGMQSAAQIANKHNLRDFSSKAGKESGKATEQYKNDLTTKKPEHRENERMLGAVSKAFDAFKDIPTALQAPFDAMKQIVRGGSTVKTDENQNKQKFESELHRAREIARRAPPGQDRDAKTQIVQAIEAAYRQTVLGKPQDTVHSAAKKQADTGARRAAEDAGGSTPAHKPHGDVDRILGSINVNFKGWCPHCSQPFDSESRVVEVNPAAGARV
jgi:hypothetical protein